MNTETLFAQIAKRKEKLDLFEKSTGKKFTIKNDKFTLTDEITGVDRRFDHVCGKEYGNFHVDLVELVA